MKKANAGKKQALSIAFLVTMVLTGMSLVTRAADEADLQQVQTHLEFLGYTVSKTERGSLVAKRPSKPNFLVDAYDSGLLFTTIYSDASGKPQSTEMMAFLNTLNSDSKLFCARFFYKDGMLQIQAFYPGTYDKPRMALFLERLDADQLVLSRNADLAKRLLGPSAQAPSPDANAPTAAGTAAAGSRSSAPYSSQDQGAKAAQQLMNDQGREHLMTPQPPPPPPPPPTRY